MSLVMLGGPEARCVGGACGARWTPRVADTSSDDTVVVFATFEGLAAALRRSPARIVWRPVAQPLPLPRRAPWVLSRVDLVVATDEVMGDAIASQGMAPTVVLPPAIDLAAAPPADSARRSTTGLRVAMVFDTLDHNATAALTLLAALATGAISTCDRCGTAPFRFSPVTAQLVPATSCGCGRTMVTHGPLDVHGYLSVQDEALAPWTYDYLVHVRRALGLDARVVFDGDDGVEWPTTDGELIGRLASFDLHLSASGTPSLPRGAFLAAAAGIPSVVPDCGAATGLTWLRTCGYRTDTRGDDSVRVWLDLAGAATEILRLGERAEERGALGQRARQAVVGHDVGQLSRSWHVLLDRVHERTSFRIGLPRLGAPTGARS
jgi:hypothetical protein